MNENPQWAEKLHPDMEYTRAEVVWAVRHEMARTVEDVLARRLRALFLDAKTAIEMAPIVAKLIAEQLNKDKDWENKQIIEFDKLAKGYLLAGS
jgi:glycerol-3-phosphate dehydrogenase